MQRPQRTTVVDFVPIHVVETVVDGVVGGGVVEVLADRGVLWVGGGNSGRWGGVGLIVVVEWWQ